MKTAFDVMNTDVIKIKKETSLKEIIDIMKEKEIGVLPVIDNEILIGVVSRDDILMKQEEAPIPPVIAFWDVLITLPTNKQFVEKIKKISGYSAAEIMSTYYLKVKTSDKVDKIVTDIIEKKLGFAIVFDENDKFCGIITKSDLINKSF